MTRTDLSRAVWRTSSYSGGNNGGGQCVEVAALLDGRIVVRDSKCPDGAVLFFTRAEMATWINGVKNDEFDDLTWAARNVFDAGQIVLGGALMAYTGFRSTRQAAVCMSRCAAGTCTSSNNSHSRHVVLATSAS